MTEQPNELQNVTEDKDQLIERYQEILMRQVEAAYEKGDMEPDVYMLFMSKVCEAETKEEAYDYYQDVFAELADYHEDRLQARILKGAEYIESIGPEHPHYTAAMKKYDDLCEQLNEQKERRRANDRGGRKRISEKAN
ncbi:hypothetical protein [Paenibacillus vini]|uniref:Uncharacterized protein n=1 Tax=Paenibacillus vini TaxID=1476024 RepID=A0ABQ4MIV2_9BACL|nr:hypothetical protein [Paenibacillus vini]GIP55920.1 hypothetical protein J42TS3_49550 [Paenibacillus vini]